MSRCLLTGNDGDGDVFESTTYGFYVGKLEPRTGRVGKQVKCGAAKNEPSKMLNYMIDMG